jgi:hypothetical protein
LNADYLKQLPDRDLLDLIGMALLAVVVRRGGLPSQEIQRLLDKLPGLLTQNPRRKIHETNDL